MDRKTVLGHIKKSTEIEVRSSQYFLWISAIIGGALIPLHAYDVLPAYPEWLFISPSYSTNNNLGWIISVWGAVLSIHGTIAALAITFMSMFISQVSEASEKDFIFICRQLVLREYKFYQFSIDAVCGLLIGVFFFVIGGGVIHYSLSMACSIYFIYQYMSIFKDLYFITEKKELIEEILLRKIESVSIFIYNQKKTTDELCLQYNNYISSYPILTSKYQYAYGSPVSFKISPNYKPGDKSIVDFDKKNIKKLSDYLQRNFANEDLKLYLNPVFHDINFYAEAYLLADITLDENQNKTIKKLIEKCFKYEDLSEDAYFFNEIVNKTQVSTFNALLSSNEPQLKFSINALVLLTMHSESINAFVNVDKYIGGLPTAKRIPPENLELFYKKLIGKLHYSDDEFSSVIFGSMFSLPMYIYDTEVYSVYFKRIHEYACQRTKYKDDGSLLDVYIHYSLQHILNINFDAFKLNTKFLANEQKYFTINQNQALTNEQVYYIESLRSIISYLHKLLDVILNEKEALTALELKDNDGFISQTIDFLKIWLNPEFLNDLYYHPMVYDILFKRASKFSDSHAQFSIFQHASPILRASSLRYNESATLALLFFPWITNSNNLNTMYIKLNEDFIKNNELDTNYIDTIIEFIDSSDFKKIISLIENVDDPSLITDFENRKEKTLSIFNEIKNKIMKYFLTVIKEMPHDLTLMQKYRDNMCKRLTQKLSEVIDIKEIILVKSIKQPIIYNLIIDKRQILPTLNNTTYSQNDSYYASQFFNHFINNLITSIVKPNIIDIVNIDELPEKKYVCIDALHEPMDEVYKFRKGFYRKNPIVNPEPYTQDGFYYICLNDIFQFKYIERRVLSTQFTKLTHQYTSSIDLFDPQLNYDLLVRMKVTINLNFDAKKTSKIYFISRENCEKSLMLEREDLALLNTKQKDPTEQ